MTKCARYYHLLISADILKYSWNLSGTFIVFDRRTADFPLIVFYLPGYFVDVILLLLEPTIHTDFSINYLQNLQDNIKHSTSIIMDPKYLFNENVEKMQPVGVEFNMTYILGASAVAGVIIAALIYWLMSNTKKSVPGDFIASSSRSRQPNTAQTSDFRPEFRTGPISDDDTDEDSDEARERLAEEQKSKKKIGVKKAAKLEMKAEKRAAREAMLIEREEKKREQEYLDQLRKEEEEKQKKEEEEREEQERLAREEQAKKEHEAYLEMAATFEVEEEGYDPEQDIDSQDKLVQFINYINEQKVVQLEHLAAQFKLRTKDVVDRIQQLVANGSLIGIIDDRGKFISITQNELDSVAKFIRQRGRVTVDELVVNSNKLINLKPEVKASM